MAITITAKLDTRGVTDGAKNVVDSVKEIGDEARLSNDKLADLSSDLRDKLSDIKGEAKGVVSSIGGIEEQSEKSDDKLKQVAKELFGQLGELKKRTDALQQELAVVGDAGDSSLSRVERSAETVAAELRNAAQGGRELTTSLRDAGLQASDTASGVDFDELVEGIKEAEVQVNVSTTKSIEDIGKLGESAKEAGKSVAESNSGMQGTVTALATGYLAVVDLLKKGYQAAIKFDAAMRSMAVSGNEGAAKVVTQLDKIWAAMEKISKDPTTQHLFDGVADGAGLAEKAVGGLMKAWTAYTGLQSSILTGFLEINGLVAEGTIETLREMKALEEQERNSYDERKKRADEEAKRVENEKKMESDLAKIKSGNDAESYKNALDQIATQEELRDVIDDLTESYKESAKEGKITDEQRANAIEKISLAQQKLREVIEKDREKEKEARDESVRLVKQETEEKKAAYEQSLKDKEAAAKAELDIERNAIEERKRLIAGTKGVDSLLNSQSMDAVKEEYARRAGESAENAERLAGFSRRGNRDALGKRADSAKQEMERAKQALDSANRVDDAIPESSPEYKGYIQSRNKERERARKEFVAAREAYKSADSERDAANEEADPRELAKIRRAAVERARRNLSSGQVGEDELRGVQADMASKTVDMAQRQGKLSKETATAYKESLAELAKQSGEIDRMNAEIENLRQVQSGISRHGERRRAQVAGSRQ